MHQEFARILEFWFERGVAGFRVDVANGLYKDAELRDNPPLDSANPMAVHFGLRFVYNTNRPETHAVYREWRKIADGYSPAAVAGRDLGPRRRAAGLLLRQRRRTALGFNFPFAFAASLTKAARLAAIVARPLPRCRPVDARCGWGPTTISAGSPPAGAGATRTRSGWPC